MLINAQTDLISAEHILAGFMKNQEMTASARAIGKNVAISSSFSEALDFCLYL